MCIEGEKRASAEREESSVVGEGDQGKQEKANKQNYLKLCGSTLCPGQ